MASYLKSTIVVLALGALLVWAFSVWKERSRATDAERRLTLVDRLETQGLPDLKLQDLSGRTFNSGDYQGKVVLLNFWASWCAPCLEEFPSMLKLVKAMKGKMVLLAISQDSQESELQAFLKTFPEAAKIPEVYVVWDKELETARQFQVDRLPESFLMDGKGRLAKKIVGSIEWFTPDSVKYVQSLLAPAP